MLRSSNVLFKGTKNSVCNPWVTIEALIEKRIPNRFQVMPNGYMDLRVCTVTVSLQISYNTETREYKLRDPRCKDIMEGHLNPSGEEGYQEIKEAVSQIIELWTLGDEFALTEMTVEFT